MRNLFLRMNGVYPIDDVTRELLQNNVESELIKKGRYLAEEGKVCRFLYYIDWGLVTHFSRTLEGDKTHAIYWGNDIVTVVESFFPQLPSEENIIAKEDTFVYYISWQQYQSAFRQSEAFKIISDKVKEDYYLRQNKHKRLIETLSNEEMIQHLLDKKPELFNRLDKRSLATYLGMSVKTYDEHIKKFF